MTDGEPLEAGGQPPAKQHAVDMEKVGRNLVINAVLGLAVSQFMTWHVFFTRSSRPTLGLMLVITMVFTVGYVIYFTTNIVMKRGAARWLVAPLLINAFLLIVGNFSTIYWAYGTTANFNIDLSRLDAIYFALGTLTTAGTGNISATSELSRGIVSIQMFLDMVFVAFALTLAVTRLSEGRKR